MNNTPTATQEPLLQPHPHDETEPCPGGCDDVVVIERRLNDGAARMNSIEASLEAFGAKLDQHMATSQATSEAMAEVLSILQAGKGFFRTIGWLMTALKWVAGIAAPLIGLWLALKDMGKH